MVLLKFPIFDAALGTVFTGIGRDRVGRGPSQPQGLGGTGWVGIQLQLTEPSLNVYNVE